ncbi:MULTISPECIES: ribosome silencing factor [Salinicola]|uniref:ribosome silencing factor n=1 Tax=Salinicola TaxID=404432 RepID=UPI0008DD66D7|nr:MULTISPECIES: ribosome silencing factor [Salinicola]MDF3917714.1 ribosome silencing factor [Salinicola salarius]OHY97574.1 ribosome silencing factor [Salinicola sp. MIT1003]
MQTDTLKSLVVDALEELKARDVVELDVAELTSVTDVMVVASGTSSRHVSALADNVIEKAKEAGLRPLGVEGQQSGEWVLVDLGDVVAHVMMPETRQLYDLERLWADLPTDSKRAADRQELRGQELRG